MIPIAGNVRRIVEEFSRNKVFVKERSNCGKAKSTMLIKAAQNKSKKIQSYMGNNIE